MSTYIEVLAAHDRLEAELAEARAQIAAKDAALREIAYLDSPQIRGMPRRRSIHEIANTALGE